MGANRGGRATFGDVGKNRAGSESGKIWGIWVWPSLHCGTQHLSLAPSPLFSLHFLLLPHPFLAWALPPSTECNYDQQLLQPWVPCLCFCQVPKSLITKRSWRRQDFFTSFFPVCPSPASLCAVLAPALVFMHTDTSYQPRPAGLWAHR